MITTSHQRSSNDEPTTVPTLWARTRAVLRWPFTNRFASVLWLALRLCLGWIWLQFSLDKFRGLFEHGDLGRAQLAKRRHLPSQPQHRVFSA